MCDRRPKALRGFEMAIECQRKGRVRECRLNDGCVVGVLLTRGVCVVCVFVYAVEGERKLE